MSWLSRNLTKLGVLDAFEEPVLTDTVQNSLRDLIERAAGKQVDKEITLDASGTTASEQIFQVTGSVYIIRLYAVVTDATTLVDCDSASFDLFPTGGAASPITDPTGDIGGVSEGSVIIKSGLITDAFTLGDAVGVAIGEQAWSGSDVFSSFIVTQKNGTDTFIRFTYTTTDAPINAKLHVYCNYRSLGIGSSVAGDLVVV